MQTLPTLMFFPDMGCIQRSLWLDEDQSKNMAVYFRVRENALRGGGDIIQEPPDTLAGLIVH